VYCWLQRSGIWQDNSPAAVAALTERLARQTGMEVIIPALEGYEFIRGQRLSFNGEPLLQLVYLGAEGAPLALCYMPTQQADTDTAVVQRHHGAVALSLFQETPLTKNSTHFLSQQSSNGASKLPMHC